MTRVGVIGHSGFVGRAVARAVEDQGLTLVAIDLPRVSAAVEHPLGRAVEEWRTGPGVWDLLIRQLRCVDVVINAAGSADADGIDRQELWSANVVLPAIVAEAAAEAGVSRMVHISTAAVQGPGPVDESTRVAPFSAYSRSKAEAEAHLLERSSGPTIVIYRATSVMGPGRLTTQRLSKRCSGRVPAVTGCTQLPLALLDNVGDAAVFLATVTGPPRIATHPWEGVTVCDVVRWSGGRLQPIPRIVRRIGVGTLRRAAGIRPSLQGAVARASLFLEGQEIRASALIEGGWVPPVPKSAFAELFEPKASSEPGPLRIAFLITRSDTVGGAHIHVRDLARSLLDLGHDVHVLIGADGPFGDILRRFDIPVVSVPSLVRQYDVLADRRAYVELKAILADLNPEILSTHSSKAGVVGRLVGRRLGIPTIFTAHGWAFTAGVARGKMFLYSVVEMAVAPLATRIICVCEHDMRLARRLLIDRLSSITCVPNAVRDVPPERWADLARTPPHMIMVARLDEQKCQHEVLAALSRLKGRSFSIDFVGDGPRRAELQSLAELLGVADRCRFLGHRNDVDSLLADAQIFVLMSNYEGMPRSVLEAMRAGLPVVASRTAGVPEVVLDEETGFVVQRHDVDALVEALGRLLDDPELRQRTGRAGRARYEAHFELSRLVDDMLSLYAEVTGRIFAAPPPPR